jgi:hypothetical protein
MLVRLPERASMAENTSPPRQEGKNLTDGPAPETPPCGDFDIRIDADGTWYYRGSPIGRKRLVRLFASVLHCDEAGQHWLITPAERGRVTVDEVPFTAVEVVAEGSGRRQRLRFRTNVDDWVEAGPEHPVRLSLAPDSGESRPYILVRERLWARILRSVYYHLVDLASERRVDGERQLGLWSNQTFFPLDPTR